MNAAQIWKSRCATADRMVAITDDIVLVANANARLLPLLQARLEQGMLPDLVPGARIAMVPFDAISTVRYNRRSRDLDIVYAGDPGRESLNVAFENPGARDQFCIQLSHHLPWLRVREQVCGPLRAATVPVLVMCASVLVGAMAWFPQAFASVSAGLVPENLAAIQSLAEGRGVGLAAALVSVFSAALAVTRFRRPPRRVLMERAGPLPRNALS